MSYPEYVDGQPPVVTLKEYDTAPWASTTCVDRSPDGKGFVVVVMQKPEQIVAKVHPSGNEALNAIFRSAHADYFQQITEQKAKERAAKSGGEDEEKKITEA